ncbi:NADase-type glycan-binding domain-containing protein [Spongisporangium articulatum]|uniref:NADase-type glycan-binding domain-containing protein n=1 Tax=Spongisporangium articulatum TaxID=3362603 RepID=A0ABW8AVD8_9ACTN
MEGSVGNDEPTVVLPEGAGQQQPTMRMPAATYQPTQALPPTAYPPQDTYGQYPPQGQYPPHGQYPPQGQYPPPGGRPPGNNRNNQTPLYIAAAVLAVVLAVLLTYLLTRPDGNTAAPTPSSSASATPSATPSETPKATTEPDPGTSGTNLLNTARRFDGPPGSGFEVLPGKIVRYDIDKLRDGDWNSVWRTPGDASGEDIEARWSKPVWIHELQLTNGYAVEDEALQDRYQAERRITRISVEVDGEQVGTYTLNEDPDVQTITLDQPVQGKRFELNIEATTDPGDPNQDFTAMTELVVR